MRRCTYCGRGGHNRRSCPALKKTIRDDPEGYYARVEATKAKNRKPRKCSYCRTEGHTKRTCKKLEIDRAEQARRASNWRRGFLAACGTLGFGPGSLIKFVDPDRIKSEWVRDRVARQIAQHGEYALVVNFRWEMLDHRQAARSSSPVHVRFPSGKEMGAMLPIEFAHMMDEYATPQFEVVGKVDSHHLGDTLSIEWHRGTDTTDWHLNLC